MEYLSESMLCSQYDWDVLSEPVQQDLYRIITEIPETTIDYRDGSFDIVSPLPYELNFAGRYNIVQRSVQPVPATFKNYTHIDTFYPEVYNWNARRLHDKMIILLLEHENEYNSL